MRAFLAFLLILISAPAAAQENGAEADRVAVLAVIDRLFDGMAAGDGDAIAALSVPSGVITAIPQANGEGDDPLSPLGWDDFAERVENAPAPLRERIFAPEVRIQGDMAMVWARFDLHVGDNFSHCGTNLFELLRQGGTWRLYHVTYTHEQTGCEAR
ncbi:nuclear transport factor 2 family protein [Pacificimonas sp. ICDLI1SI03]